MSEPLRPIHVTRPYLPPIEEFLPSLRAIWESRSLTNAGPFHERLEREIADYLGVDHVALFANGTLALVTALQALRVTGEVITTPYSFVATSHALLWNGVKPIFVDIEADSFNIDPDKIEAAITPRTTAIMPVHVYGNPCQVAPIAEIAERYGLRVIYDAAHAFGARMPGNGGESVAAHGDLSVLSFHATKLFNTFEGGAIVAPDAKAKQRIDHLKNFGFVDETSVVAPGINGKMNEFQAALGLAQLKHMPHILKRRGEIDARYRALLADCKGIVVPARAAGGGANHAYFPILVTDAFRQTRDELYDALRAQEIYARRYFYPLISDFPMYRDLPSASPSLLPVARRIASQVICLPIYPDLNDEDMDRVVDVIRNAKATR